MSLFDEAGVEPPPLPPVMAATKWQDNSAMTLDLSRLGYIHPDGLILDPTYQDGTWWKRWPDGGPRRLVTNSLDPANGAMMHFDFTAAPFPDSTFDCVAYDPPYVSKGGRKTSTIEDHQRRYGLVDAPDTPDQLQNLINLGSSEMSRVLNRGGYLLVKCQDYVSSGKIHWGTEFTRWWIEQIGYMRCVDRLYFLNNGSPQPLRDRKCPKCHGEGKVSSTLSSTRPCGVCAGTGRIESVQQHARVNVSTLWVFRKG